MRSFLLLFLYGGLLIKAEAVEKPAFGMLRSRTPTAHRWRPQKKEETKTKELTTSYQATSWQLARTGAPLLNRGRPSVLWGSPHLALLRGYIVGKRWPPVRCASAGAERHGRGLCACPA